MSRILHITDLHVTKPHKDLDDVWNGPDAFLTEQGDTPFDFIIVSGDLSQKAEPREYDDLLAFAEQRLLPRLVDREDRRRIIFVPGNHDVSWTSDVFAHVSLTGEKPERIEEKIKAFRELPAEGGTRLSIGSLAHLELFVVKEADYASRFRNVQNFLNRFYKDSLGRAGCRPFELDSPAAGNDWSCHFFEKENIVFVGFSSCRHNDKHWTGATIDHRSIKAAQGAIRKLRTENPGLQVVAVWHHGFSSEIGRPDRLTLRDLGAIYGVGARLGFHGHTHANNLQEHAFLHERFVVVATGSIGAGGSELPTGVNNQFSIVEVFPSRLRLQRVRRTHHYGNFEAERDVQRLSIEHAAARKLDGATLACHRREWVVNEDGIARVSVELTGVVAKRPLTLAVLNPPYCNARGESNATGTYGAVTVTSVTLPDRRMRFSAADVGEAPSLTWAYNVSNAVAISREELALLPERHEWFPNIEAHEDIRSHTIRDDCDNFEMSLKFVPAPEEPMPIRVLVERRTPDAADRQWDLDQVEMARVSLERQPYGGVLRVRAPIVGHRYSIAFAPPTAGRRFPTEAIDLTTALLEHCRGGSYLLNRLRDDLTRNIRIAIEAVFPPDCNGDVGHWVGMLWQHPKRRLVPSFGSFPAASWAASFSAGAGVAGHAFRHSRGVAWSRSNQSTRGSTIYQERTERGPHSIQYDWVLCVPLLVALDGPALGVVSFARVGPTTTPEARHIRELAQAGESVVNRPAWIALRTAIHAAFYITLNAARELTQSQRDYAGACYRATIDTQVGAQKSA